MKGSLCLLAGIGLFTALVATSPATAPELSRRAAEEQLIPSKIIDGAQLEGTLGGVFSDVTEVSAVASAIIGVVQAIVPSPAPTSIVDAISKVASIYATHPTDFVESALALVLNGLTPGSIANLALAQSSEENSSNNNNLINPTTTIYPKKAPDDAPYSISESVLRGAINIPSGFTYGNVTPVILIPGTGATGGMNFIPNFGKKFAGSSYADPVYLNIPDAQLNDIQLNSEFVAYAINYISAISGDKKVALLSWSQGSLDGQWAFTYWPSTRAVVADFITISGDLDGTVLAYLACPNFPQLPCPPSIYQQEYNSNFVKTLRNAGGDSAYVPTTSVYSAFDQIVLPQSDSNASAFVLDARNVGVSNTELQNACTIAQPGGTLYAHEGVLYNALAFALAKDALTHDGPGLLSRIDVVAECQKIATDGLSVLDVVATEALIPVFVLRVLTYASKIFTEPTIKDYARKDIPA
ncbi:hypothetical protein PVAG01_06338 [Phlyctema vagabunda]|uniref:Alpha/beta-hydrolase n=1 Tax=Phlyctema vagabunda TaxID=108571 RepID=A0ABR4PGF7_9HELO